MLNILNLNSLALSTILPLDFYFFNVAGQNLTCVPSKSWLEYQDKK